MAGWEGPLLIALKAMKIFPFTFLAGGLMSLSSVVTADTLPALTEVPWLGFWQGYERREFDFGVNDRGEGELFLKERVKGDMERITDSRSVKVFYLVEEETGGAWKKRTLEVLELESEQAASDDLKECSFVAPYKGGTKVKINHRFDGDEVFITVEMLEGESQNPVRLGVEVLIPDLYRLATDIDQRELKKKLKGDKVAVETLAGKKMKFDLSDEINLETEKDLVDGVLEFSLDCKNLAEKTISMRSTVEKTGKIVFGQKGPMNEGFTATWYPMAVEEGKPLPELVIKVK